MNRRLLYEQSKEPYRMPLNKIARYSVKESSIVCLMVVAVSFVILYFFQRDRWVTSIWIPILVFFLVVIFFIILPLRRSVRFLKEQENISGELFAQRKDHDLSWEKREWLLLFTNPGFKIFARKAIKKINGFTSPNISMTGDGSKRIYLEYEDTKGKQHKVDFQHSEKNKRIFEIWYRS